MNLTLGQFIEELKAVDPDGTVTFDVLHDLTPTNFDSYRGYYEQLALGYNMSRERMTARTLIGLAQQCLGKTFDGYKGGRYVMDKSTGLWMANPGRATGRAIVGLDDLTIMTKADD